MTLWYVYTYEKYFRMGKIEHPKTMINELKIIFKLYHVYIIVKFLHTINIKNKRIFEPHY